MHPGGVVISGGGWSGQVFAHGDGCALRYAYMPPRGRDQRKIQCSEAGGDRPDLRGAAQPATARRRHASAALPRRSERDARARRRQCDPARLCHRGTHSTELRQHGLSRRPLIATAGGGGGIGGRRGRRPEKASVRGLGRRRGSPPGQQLDGRSSRWRVGSRDACAACAVCTARGGGQHAGALSQVGRLGEWQ